MNCEERTLHVLAGCFRCVENPKPRTFPPDESHYCCLGCGSTWAKREPPKGRHEPCESRGEVELVLLEP